MIQLTKDIHEISTRYIVLEWARKMIEHDLSKLKNAGLKYPRLFEDAALRVLNRLSLQMRDVKKGWYRRALGSTMWGKTMWDGLSIEV